MRNWFLKKVLSRFESVEERLTDVENDVVAVEVSRIADKISAGEISPKLTSHILSIEGQNIERHAEIKDVIDDHHDLLKGLYEYHQVLPVVNEQGDELEVIDMTAEDKAYMKRQGYYDWDDPTGKDS